jgi:hypothetical protein
VNGFSDSARSEAPLDAAAWARLAGRAVWQLEHPDQLSPREALSGLVLQLRLWSYRRRGAQLSWSLFLPNRKDGSPLVRELRWNALADQRRMGSALRNLKRRPAELPTVRLRDALVEEAALEPFLVEAPRILAERMPATGVESDVDRDVSGVEGYRSLTHVRFEWEGDGPEAGGIVAWVGRLRRLLEEALQDRETV